MPADKQHWQINTEKLAADIRKAARAAHTEEDLKMHVEPLLQRAFSDMGIDVEVVQYEKRTGFRSKMDAVYGFLILEYKAPGKLSRAGEVTKSKSQLQQYMEDEAKRVGQDKEAALEKTIGVCLDGDQILFARFTRAPRLLSLPAPIPVEKQADLFPHERATRGFQFLGPYPITAASVANLLIFARASARRPLTASDLSKVFGPAHTVARQAVSELYSALMRAQRRSAPSRIKSFFVEWDRIFGVVYGQELEKAEQAAAETAQLYQLPGGVRLKQLLFSIHTYYAFLMKLIAIELLSLQRESTVTSFVEGLIGLDDDALRAQLGYLESGVDFNKQGIQNFLEADFFSWYLDGWSPTLAGAFRGVIRALAEFEPATPVLEPDWTHDLLQKLYELIVPQKLRHDLGEYYTPDWLASYLIDQSGYKGLPDTRFLDPACGSGTFLVQAIHRAIRCAESKEHVSVAETARSILKNIVGFDLNPLAVLASRTNYLIAFSRLIQYIRPISLPVYLCDSVVPPDRVSQDRRTLYDDDVVVFTTTKGDYVFPLSMKDKSRIDLFTGMVETGLRAKMDEAKFSRLLAKELPLPEAELSALLAVYGKIKALDDKGENGIWARYIKNAFAPAYMGEFDFVIGNPPWIRWGYLADDYRKRTLPMWQDYGLFSLKGHQTRLGQGEKDFSMLFTYAAADRYLKDQGILGFVITAEVFKSKGAGEGFRRFQIGPDGPKLKVLSMEDMVDLKPFQAANKTSIFVMQKGKPTTYPVPVTVWKRKAGVGRVPPEWLLAEVLKNTEHQKVEAIPVDPEKLVSSWQTADAKTLKFSARLKGTNHYQARLGARVEPYGVFWLNLKEVRPDGLLVVSNQHDRGKRTIPKVQDAIESKLVYPAVSGGEIVRFGVKQPFYVLISQDPKTREPYPEDWMMERAPLTYGYLKQFESILLSRGSNVVRQFAEKTEFYAMYGIGEYTFAPYRVVWKRMASRMEAVVLSTIKTPFSRRPIISTDTTSLFSVQNQTEAHYLCAVMNSALVGDYIRSFSSAGRGFGAPSVTNTLAIPKFERSNKLHQRLAKLSLEAHKLVAGDSEPNEPQAAINETVKQLWITKS